MKPCTWLVCFLVVTAVSTLGSICPVVAQVFRQPEHSGVALAIRRDLAAIPSGSQPTAAQVQALSADLGKLFTQVEHQPTVTLDYLAAKLADPAVQGQLRTEDCRVFAHKLLLISNKYSFVDERKISSLKFILAKTGAEPNGLKQIAGALRAL